MSWEPTTAEAILGAALVLALFMPREERPRISEWQLREALRPTTNALNAIARAIREKE